MPNILCVNSTINNSVAVDYFPEATFNSWSQNFLTVCNFRQMGDVKWKILHLSPKTQTKDVHQLVSTRTTKRWAQLIRQRNRTCWAIPKFSSANQCSFQVRLTHTHTKASAAKHSHYNRFRNHFSAQLIIHFTTTDRENNITREVWLTRFVSESKTTWKSS